MHQNLWEDSAMAAVDAAFQEHVKLVCTVRFTDDVAEEVSAFDRKKFMAGLAWALHCRREALDGIDAHHINMREENCREQGNKKIAPQAPND
jgi:hypothetical protein